MGTARRREESNQAVAEAETLLQQPAATRSELPSTGLGLHRNHLITELR